MSFKIYQINYFVIIPVFLLFSLGASAQRIAIKAGHLFDTESGRFVDNQLIIVEDGKILSVGKMTSSVHSEKIIDLSESWVMPGFIDSHVHLEMEFSKNIYLEKFRKNDADKAFDAAVYAKRTLMAGFTTVRDLGGSGVNTSLAKAIALGKTDGPRIFSAGSHHRRAFRSDEWLS